MCRSVTRVKAAVLVGRGAENAMDVLALSRFLFWGVVAAWLMSIDSGVVTALTGQVSGAMTG